MSRAFNILARTHRPAVAKPTTGHPAAATAATSADGKTNAARCQFRREHLVDAGLKTTDTCPDCECDIPVGDHASVDVNRLAVKAVVPAQSCKDVAIRRLTADAERMRLFPVPLISAKHDAGDVFHWSAVVLVPQVASPPRVIRLRLAFPDTYPIHGPSVWVLDDDAARHEARWCPDAEWSPAYNVGSFLVAVASYVADS